MVKEISVEFWIWYPYGYKTKGFIYESIAKYAEFLLKLVNSEYESNINRVTLGNERKKVKGRKLNLLQKLSSPAP